MVPSTLFILGIFSLSLQFYLLFCIWMKTTLIAFVKQKEICFIAHFTTTLNLTPCFNGRSFVLYMALFSLIILFDMCRNFRLQKIRSMKNCTILFMLIYSIYVSYCCRNSQWVLLEGGGGPFENKQAILTIQYAVS